MVLVAGLMFALAKPGVVAGIIRGLIEKSGRAATFQHRAENLLAGLGRVREQPTSLITAFGGAVVVQGLLVVFYMCAARSLSVPLPLFLAGVLVPVAMAVQLAPVSINGFGVREAVFSFFFVRFGLGVEAAVAVSLLGTALVMLFSMGGGALFLMRRH